MVKRRVHALKNIQVDLLKLEAQFYQEVQKLEAKYQTLYQPLMDKVSDSVLVSRRCTCTAAFMFAAYSGFDTGIFACGGFIGSKKDGHVCIFFNI